MCYIYIYIYGFFFVLLVWHTIRKYNLPCTNLYILNSLLIVSTSNELQPHLRNLLAHSMANINDNFWQAISVFMFQGEYTVNLYNLFLKPSTPILTWTNPRQSFLGNYDYMSHFTYDNSSVSVRFHFLDLHLPSSASVWSILFEFSTM